MNALPQCGHEAPIAWGYEGELVFHVSRDSTAIEAREKPAPKLAEVKEKRRVERQLQMGSAGMIADLPRLLCRDQARRQGLQDAHMDRLQAAHRRRRRRHPDQLPSDLGVAA